MTIGLLAAAIWLREWPTARAVLVIATVLVWVPRAGLPSDVPADSGNVGCMLGCCALLAVSVGCSGAGTTTMLVAWLTLVAAYLGLVRLDGDTNPLEPGILAVAASLPLSVLLPVLEKMLWHALR